ncbi:MAG: dihydropteroate synthase [Rhodospirillales bacterium]
MTAPVFAGVPLDRPRVMGALNVTPDSFSDGGELGSVDAAVRRAEAMAAAGADFLDIGGESTRPGAAPVPADEQIARTVPVIRAVRGLGLPISIDTRLAAVMRAALNAGAAIINDVSALTHDAEAMGVAADAQCPVVLMHMQGGPETMQDAPHYDDVVAEVRDYLMARARACMDAGVAAENIALDPGIGFGKTVEHNLTLIRNLGELAGAGGAAGRSAGRSAGHRHPVVLGVSRKGFIAKLSAGEAAQDRLGGSLAAALAGASRGADILRVHDTAQTVQAVKIWTAVEGAP